MLNRPATLEASATRLRLTGTVQGVGMRPYLWQLATHYGLVGQVWNDPHGVVIQISGTSEGVAAFIDALPQQLPPLAKLQAVQSESLATDWRPPASMSIVTSDPGRNRTALSMDAATCSQCVAEILNPEARRYRYPFTNCTHCGPRFSIIRRAPYDRSNTTMADFSLCVECDTEYQDPADRRFHAQPIACPQCGPKLWAERADEAAIGCDQQQDAIQLTASWLKAGEILALKGIGGFHLLCDATNHQAVERLRQRKRRATKPFALMAQDVEQVARYTHCSSLDIQLLQSVAAPIVLLTKNDRELPANIAPGQAKLGFMLPYTPLHHLLLRAVDGPLVVTSGNAHQQPQCISNEQARQRLSGIADGWLLHNRDIETRLDDSVVQVVSQRPMVLRRGRGYAPTPIALPSLLHSDQSLLAFGADLKNTFCLARAGEAIVSAHIGDLAEVETYQSYQDQIQHYTRLYDFEPTLLVTDQHPQYLATAFGQSLAQEMRRPLFQVQHHHAHIVATLVEQGYFSPKPVIGLALDGTGYGMDGGIWGGELLLASYRQSERLGGLPAVPLLGGSQAVRQPWRNTLAHLLAIAPWDYWQAQFGEVGAIQALSKQPIANLSLMHERGLNSPMASSAGRLFDAVAAALGLAPETISYEGEAAMALEAKAMACFDEQQEYAYPIELVGYQINLRPMWLAIFADLKAAVSVAIIAARFHQGLAQGLATLALTAARAHDCDTLAVGGGTLQNGLLLRALRLHTERQLNFLQSSQLPLNDGGISVGQVAVALANLDRINL